jgi:hypothetical protein
MKEPTLATVKRLFALSGNRCIHPECNLPIVEDSGVVTGIVCHIKARSPKGPRYDKSQTDEQRHHFDNLILLCSRHSKIIDTDVPKYSVELLTDMKTMRERNGSEDLPNGGARNAEALLVAYRDVYIAKVENLKINKPKVVNIKEVKRKVVIDAPEGSIASILAMRNYVKHLVDRYNEFAAMQPGRPFSYAVIYNTIKKEFGAKWDMVSTGQFPRLCAFLHRRIDQTRQGRINSSKEDPNYSTYDVYLVKYPQK